MEIYLVGGAIRDSYLNLPVKDKDWVVVGATPELMVQQGFKPVGKDFPVFLHPFSGEEYALARTEKKIGHGYTGFTCNATPYITLQQDLERRDLTINAIACDAHGNYYDPFNGFSDLKNRILRHISNTFNEDPLRLLRVARFAATYAHLNFTIADETLALMYAMSNSGELNHLTVERIWKETERALHSRNPELYFQVLKDCNALAIIFPELNNLFKKNITNKYNKILNLGVHTLNSLSIATKISSKIEIRFAILCHDFGKISLSNKLDDCYKQHKKIGVEIVCKFCQRLRIPKYLKKIAILTINFHRFVHHIYQLKPHNIINLFYKIDAWRNPYRIEQLAIISEADTRSFPGYEKKKYFQGNYFRRLFKIANKVKFEEINKNNSNHGLDINKKIFNLRSKAIKNCKNDHYS
ncbi:MAG: multifunctional CCA addition/repair protein [Candidatus Dasytiphilus stammeri]